MISGTTEECTNHKLTLKDVVALSVEMIVSKVPFLAPTQEAGVIWTSQSSKFLDNIVLAVIFVK